jgi:hypothetical protein
MPSLLIAALALLIQTPPATLKYDLPEGWASKAPSSKMRVAELTLPRADNDSEDASLVITYFGGQGGSVQANFDRGTFVAETAPGSAEHHNKPGFHLRAAVIESSKGGPFFVRLVGPAKTVAKWDASVQSFFKSLRVE